MGHNRIQNPTANPAADYSRRFHSLRKSSISRMLESRVNACESRIPDNEETSTEHPRPRPGRPRRDETITNSYLSYLTMKPSPMPNRATRQQHHPQPTLQSNILL